MLNERPALTKREEDVLKLLSSGLPNKSIATVLSISEHTVKVMIRNAVRKFEVGNRVQAALAYLGLPVGYPPALACPPPAKPAPAPLAAQAL
jgi:DNA-binding NarL/FixJ family response regulator